MTEPMKMYVGGDLVAGSSTIAVINPATETVVGEVSVAGYGDVDKALASAAAAFPTWSRTPIIERQQWMHRLRDAVIANEELLRDCIHQEMAKPWAATQEDFDSLKNSLAFYAEEIARVHDDAIADRAGTHVHRMVHESVGVSVAYIAWNFPLLNLAFKIGPAMAAGSPIIIRPSEKTPLSAYALGALCKDIGLPPGVVQILCTEDFAVADHMTASKIPAMITLIGSTPTGQHIMRTGASTIKRYSMELGGNAPVLVFADADLDRAAEVICNVKFGNSGQVCVTPNRVFVDSRVAEALTERIVDRARACRLGFDKAADIDMGPVIDGAAWTRIKGLVDDAVTAGAALLAGGGRPAGFDTGHYFEPTVLANVTEAMDVYRKEIFGPVVSLIPFSDETGLLDKANDCEDGGLTAYVFTRNLEKAERYASGLRYGEIQINGVKYDIDLPHGGIGQSGIGHDCSALALKDYLIVKRVTRQLEAETP